MGNAKDRGGGGDQRLFEKIKVFLTNQKHILYINVKDDEMLNEASPKAVP